MTARDDLAGAPTVAVRRARPADASDLAVLVDMASFGLASYLWMGAVLRGEAVSPLEIGRSRALAADAPMSYTRAWIAELDGVAAGMLRGFRQPDPMPEPDWERLGPHLRPLVELEREAPGSWYVNVVAVFPEARRHGVGAALLAHAEKLARDDGAPRLTLTVEDDNPAARRLYARSGYREISTRPFVSFRSGQTAREWILMEKPL